MCLLFHWSVDEHKWNETEKQLKVWQIVNGEAASGTSCKTKKEVNSLLSPFEV